METIKFLLRLMLQFSQNLRLIVTQKTGFDESRQHFQIHMTDLVKVGCLIVNGIHTLLHPVISLGYVVFIQQNQRMPLLAEL